MVIYIKLGTRHAFRLLSPNRLDRCKAAFIRMNLPISIKERCPCHAWLITVLCLMLAIPGVRLDRPAFHGGGDCFAQIAQHVIADLPGNPAEATDFSTAPKHPGETGTISPELLDYRLPQARTSMRQTASNSSWHNRDHLPTRPRPPCTLNFYHS
jgi:hypothetical protein